MATTTSSRWWPQYQQDAQNTGVSVTATPPAADVEAKRLGDTNIRTPPAVTKDGIYGGTGLGFGKFDRTTGEQRWSYELEGHISTSPAVVDGTVYVASSDGIVHAVDTESGAGQWMRSPPGKLARTAHPTVTRERVYVSTSDDTEAIVDPGRLTAYDRSTGNKLWAHEIKGPLSCAVAEGTVYLTSWDTFLVALDATTGSVQWEHVIWEDDSSSAIRSPPTLWDDLVFAGDVSNDQVLALDAASGEQVWAYSEFEDFSHSSPAVADGTLYIGTAVNEGETADEQGAFGKVYAFDARTGDRRWVTETDTQVQGAIAVGNDTVYAATFGGSIYALDPATGEKRWRFPNIDTPTPVLAGDAVYAPRSDEGVVELTRADSVTPPNAAFSWNPNEPPAGQPVTFSASDSTATTGAIVTYEWQFEGASPRSASGPEPDVTFNAAGRHRVTLTVTDSNYQTATTRKTVVVQESTGTPTPSEPPPSPDEGLQSPTATRTATPADTTAPESSDDATETPSPATDDSMLPVVLGSGVFGTLLLGVGAWWYRNGGDESADDTSATPSSVHARSGCPSCGRTLDGSEKYCTGCGYNLTDQRCPDCDTELDGGESYCPSCGHNLSE